MDLVPSLLQTGEKIIKVVGKVVITTDMSEYTIWQNIDNIANGGKKIMQIIQIKPLV